MSKGSEGKYLEEIRRSQLISPYGIGAIMPTLTGETYTVAGLDKWSYGPGENTKAYLVDDDRLKKRLRVSELRLPPEYKTKGEGAQRTVPVYRFPGWYYCPICGAMEKLKYETYNRKCNSSYSDNNMVKCSERKRKQYLVPERLVMVCEAGHMSDVDFMALVHEKNPSKYNRNTCRLTRKSFGSTGSITNLKYVCSCGEYFKFNNSILNTEYKCNGAKPWLGINEESDLKDNCSAPMKITQSGSLNVWYPKTVNSILIPPDNHDEKIIVQNITQYRDLLLNSVTDGVISEIVSDIVFKDVEDKSKIQYYIDKMISDKAVKDEVLSESEYRYTEYKALRKSYGSNTELFHCVKQDIEKYRDFMKEYFERISIVKKLKESRVFTGFSRIIPNENLDFTYSYLSNKEVTWLPAIEVYGEGIYLEFRKDKVKEWLSRENVNERVRLINSNYRNSKGYRSEIGDLRPEYILIHSFAHILINQLSYECGYSAASLREKIYCLKGQNEQENEMYGMLLYTASGDSEGSLGGLSRMGNPGYIENVIINAIENAKWCSADPICISTKGQGPESTNLAACYNCTLLPETSCENGNRLLDRALIIGELDKGDIGYFNKIVYN